MIYTVVRKNSYQDSINLMLLTNRINTLEGVARSQIMMGTDANKDIFKNSGLYSDEVEKAAPSDMVIVVEADDEKIVDKVLEETKVFLNDLSVKKKGNDIKTAKNWDEAVDMLPPAVEPTAAPTGTGMLSDLSVFAAVLAGSRSGAGIRFGRSFDQSVEPPRASPT